jgi:hypothetical protein
MSLYDYKISQQLMLKDPPFYALIMAAMWRADTDNLEKLRDAFPCVWRELEARYNAPGGLLKDESEENY